MSEEPLDPEDLRGHVAAAARLLPAQGPITTFIHHNTLHAFEHLPFEEAVAEAARVLGTEPFMPLSWYRRELARGRIRAADIDAVLESDGPPADAPTLAGDRLEPRELARLILVNDIAPESAAAARWTLTETDAVVRPAADTAPGFSRDLWHACLEAASLSRPPVPRHRPPVRHRDLVLAVDPALDTDALVHPLLIRLAAAFLDQGVAVWPMPGREDGFLAATARLYATGPRPADPWARDLAAALEGPPGRDPLEVVARELGRLGVPGMEQGEFISQTLLALRGWAGMFHQLEIRPDRAPVRPVRARLADFLAVRLVLDRLATQWACRRLRGRRRPDERSLASLRTELRDRCTAPRGPGTLSRALLLHRVSLLAGLSPHDLRSLGGGEVLALERVILTFCGQERRRLLHLAYERRHRIETLDTLSLHRGHAGRPHARPGYQIIVCIDDRLESLRRHVEELGPDRETFGAAGFFGVPMYYRGLGDWHAAPLCPIVLRPEHSVFERPERTPAARTRTWQRLRKLLARPAAVIGGDGRSLFGSCLAVTAGAVAAVPLVARVVLPRFMGRLSRRAESLIGRPARTRLVIERTTPDRLPDGTWPGFAVTEMTDMVRRVLEDTGLTTGFARLVAVIGHGSSSLNNPHESAYNCGACGGGHGGPNGRAFAAMANDPRVRESLAATGISIPADTWFVGGGMDTCADSVAWFDADRVPEDHAADFRRLERDLEAALAADALERCRRFDSASSIAEPRRARHHVEARSDDLAEVRPELGHATNAICIVGRRARSRGLFLDRRAFLVSYDPTADAAGEILARTLSAVVPVCVGINLEYLFSTIDNTTYGAGTKLPHNVTGLLGVMDGHASDLRTGLPRQMVELHEPVRLLLVIDGPPERVRAVVAQLPGIERLVANEWLRLAAWDDGGDAWIWQHDGFVRHDPQAARLPVVDRSIDWFAGRTGHLPPARVLAGASTVREAPHP